MVAYRVGESRAGDCAKRHPRGSAGARQVDGYQAYKTLVRVDQGNGGVLLANCWAASMNTVMPALRWL